MRTPKLKALDITEYNLIANKDPQGSYDRKTRDHLDAIIEKLRVRAERLSDLEAKLLEKFQDARFTALDESGRMARRELTRHRISDRTQRVLIRSSASLITLVVLSLAIYQFALNATAQKKVDLAVYQGLGVIGLAAPEEVMKVKQELGRLEQDLVKTKQEKQELAELLDEMVRNNSVPENLKMIVKRVYNNPRTKYVKTAEAVDLKFDGKTIGHYSTDPNKWYILGVLDRGVLKIVYEDKELMEIETIFGRKDEETPLGEYAIKDKLYHPTWYKREVVNGKKIRRVIPFGDPDHEIGQWWMGLKRLGKPVPGSYGIHGVNVSVTNDFYKKNYDWRSGSAGCPNVQEWYLDFLAHVIPKGTVVNIVQKDKWAKAA